MPDAGHNRAQEIRDVCAELQKLISRKDAITDQIRNLKQERIKGGLDMKVSDFNVAFRMYQLEQDDRDWLVDTIRECFTALGFGDQLNWLDALAKGDEQRAGDAAGDAAGEDEGGIDLVITSDQAAAPVDEEPGDGAPAALRPAGGDDDWDEAPKIDANAEVPYDAGRVFNEGEQAGRSGAAKAATPYPPEHPAHSLWEKGRKVGAEIRKANGAFAGETIEALADIGGDRPDFPSAP